VVLAAEDCCFHIGLATYPDNLGSIQTGIQTNRIAHSFTAFRLFHDKMRACFDAIAAPSIIFSIGELHAGI
jgi:hypothetical protein